MSGVRAVPFARFVPPVVLVAVALGAASAALLYFGDMPRVDRLSPTLVRDVVFLLLLVTGVAAPLTTLTVPRWRRRPSLTLAGVCASAALAHAVALGGLVRAPGQDATSNIALVIFFLLALFCLVLLGEEQNPAR